MWDPNGFGEGTNYEYWKKCCWLHCQLTWKHLNFSGQKSKKEPSSPPKTFSQSLMLLFCFWGTHTQHREERLVWFGFLQEKNRAEKTEHTTVIANFPQIFWVFGFLLPFFLSPLQSLSEGGCFFCNNLNLLAKTLSIPNFPTS